MNKKILAPRQFCLIRQNAKLKWWHNYFTPWTPKPKLKRLLCATRQQGSCLVGYKIRRPKSVNGSQYKKHLIICSFWDILLFFCLASFKDPIVAKDLRFWRYKKYNVVYDCQRGKQRSSWSRNLCTFLPKFLFLIFSPCNLKQNNMYVRVCRSRK